MHTAVRRRVAALVPLVVLAALAPWATPRGSATTPGAIAVGIRSGSLAYGGHDGNLNTYTYTPPAVEQIGDLEVLSFTINPQSGQQSLSGPSGWTLLSGAPWLSSTDGYGPSLSVYYHVKAAADPVSYTWTKGGSSNGYYPFEVTSAAYTNVNTASLTSYAEVGGTNVTSVVVPSVTGTAGGQLLDFATSETAYNSGTASATIPSGTSQADIDDGVWERLTTATQPLTAAGATGTRTVTFSKSVRAVGVVWALAPGTPAASVRSGTAATATSPSTSTTYSYSPPAAVQVGDLEVVAFALDSESEGIQYTHLDPSNTFSVSSIPAGWFQATVPPAVSGASDTSQAQTLVFLHPKAAGDPASFTWTKAAGTTGAKSGNGHFAMPVVSVAVTGVAIPQGGDVGFAGTTGATSVNAPSLPSYPGGLLLGTDVTRNVGGSAEATVTVSGMTLAKHGNDGATTGLDVFTQPVTNTAVNTGTRTFAASASVHMAASTILLRPAATDPSGLNWESGVATDASGGLPAINQWRGRQADVSDIWPSRTSWGELSNPDIYYQISGFQNFPGKLAIGTTLLPNAADADGSNYPNDNPAVPATLAKCASGNYSAYMKAYANSLKASLYPGGNRGDSIIRLGWEFNTVTDNTAQEPHADYSDWIGCWQQWYTTVKAIDPLAVFDWNPNKTSDPSVITSQNVLSVYPGDAYVDVIGVDYYNEYNAVTTQTDWNNEYNTTQNYNNATLVNGMYGPKGLGSWLALARLHDKQLSVPEWAVVEGNPGTTDAGNTLWLNDMVGFFKANASAVHDEVYFDYYSGFGCEFVLYPSTCSANAGSASAYVSDYSATYP